MVRVLLIVGMLVLAASCRSSQNNVATRSVEVIEAIPATASELFSTSGVVSESHNMKLGFKAAGQIERILVKEGDFVRKGQLLAKLDAKDYQLGLDATQISYDQLSREVARMKALYEKKGISQNDYDKATSGLKQLGVKLEADRRMVEYTQLFAPVDGYVVSVNNSPSEMVDAGTPVLTFIDVAGMEVIVDIPVSLYLKRAQIREIRCTAPFGVDMAMTMTDMAPLADGNQLYQMRLRFAAGPDRRITSGMNVGVNISVAGEKSGRGFLVPSRAVRNDGEREVVWIVDENSTIHSVPVRTDGFSKGLVKIVEGLSGDEKVVKAAAQTLVEGEAVNVLATSSSTNVGNML